MEKTVEAVYSQTTLEQFLAAFQLDKQYKLLGDFENYVYEVTRDNHPYILRVTHSSHRKLEEIHGELDWMTFLLQHGVHVPTVYKSTNQLLVEQQLAADGSVFYACLFSKVTGYPVRVKDEQFNEVLFQHWGKEIGKIHRVTKNYSPEKTRRKQWFEDDLFTIEKYVPTESIVIERAKEIIHKLKQLPKDDYGLIHNDIHYGNFLYDGKELYIFDFDDACYFWHVSDIAIPLYYSCFRLFTAETPYEVKTNFAKRFLDAFIEGYSLENTLPSNWELLLPLFLKVRDITLYAALNKKIAPEDRSSDIQQKMTEIKQRIEQDLPIVSIEEGIED